MGVFSLTSNSKTESHLLVHKAMAKNFALFLLLIVFLLGYDYCDGVETLKSTQTTSRLTSSEPTSSKTVKPTTGTPTKSPAKKSTTLSPTTRPPTTATTKATTQSPSSTIITLGPETTTSANHTFTITITSTTTVRTTTSNSTGNMTVTTEPSNSTTTTQKVSTTTILSTTSSPGSPALGTGSIVLIVLGSLLGIALILGGIVLYIKKRRARMLDNERQAIIANDQSISVN